MERQLCTFSTIYRNHQCPSQHTGTHLLFLRFKSSMPNCKSVFYSGFTYFKNTDCLDKPLTCLGSHLWLVHQQIQPGVCSSSCPQEKGENIEEISQFSWCYDNHGARYFHWFSMLIITNIEYLDKTHVHCSGLFELKSNKDNNVQARLNHISFNQTHPIIIVGDSRGYIQVCFYSIFHSFQTNVSGFFTKLCNEIILKWIQTCHVWAGRHPSSQHTDNHSNCWSHHLIITKYWWTFYVFLCAVPKAQPKSSSPEQGGKTPIIW